MDNNNDFVDSSPARKTVLMAQDEQLEEIAGAQTEDRVPSAAEESSVGREHSQRSLTAIGLILRAAARQRHDGYHGVDSLSSFWEAVDSDPMSTYDDDTHDLIAPLPTTDISGGNIPLDAATLPTVDDPEDDLLQPYVYQKLPTSTSIRLLEILKIFDPAKGDGTPIECSMHTVDLADDPKYSALSYTWGLPQLMYRALYEKPDVKNATEKCFPVICDGRTLMVAKNLHDALEVIQADEPRDCVKRATSKEPPRFVWIDALCINQEDLKERNAQVEMMGDIYQRAEVVLIWLGPQKWYSWPALECCKVISELANRSRGADLSHVDIYDSKWWADQDMDGMWSTKSNRPHWEALYLYLQHTWFRRSWIVQEVAFARVAIMFCGWTFMPWDYFARSCGWLVHQGWHIQIEECRRYLTQGMTASSISQRLVGPAKFDIMAHMAPETARAIHFFVRGRPLSLPMPAVIEISKTRSFCQQERRLGAEMHASVLREALERFRSFDATDGKDKIYAFLSIAEHAVHRSRQSLDRPIRVSYEASIQEVFTAATSYVLSSAWPVGHVSQLTSRSPELLWQVEDRAYCKVLDLPSWVPDYSVPCTPTPFEDGLTKQWNVWPLVFRLRDPPRVIEDLLFSEGVFIDEILEVAAPKGDLLLHTVRATERLPEIYRATDHPNEATRDGTSIATSTPVENLINELTAEEFIAALDANADSQATIPRSQNLGEDPGDAEDLHKVYEEFRKVNHQLRGALSIMRSPRPQSKVEALWRTLLLDYCGEDPAPLDVGFAIGDWVARRIEETYIPHLVRPSATTRGDLEAALQTWQILQAAEASVDDAEVCWPADTPHAAAKLREYARNDWMAASATSVYHQYQRAGEPMDEDAIQQTLLCRALATQAPPIRFIPTWEQIKAYLLRPNNVKLGPTRAGRQARFFKQYNKYNPGRRVFRTRKGWLGNGHQSARPGDQVWFLAHCTVPFILRPVKAGESKHLIRFEGFVDAEEATMGESEKPEIIFNMVGACYVHGLMHREGGFDEDDRDVVRTVVIE